MSETDDIAAESPFALLTDAETRAWYAYMKVQLRLRYEMNRQLRADTGLSLADYDVLVALISDPATTLRVSALATRLGWERSRVSHHARRMAERDLVELGVDARDRRSTVVSLSAEGRSVLGEASVGHIDFVRRSFLGAFDDAQLRDLADTMDAAYDRLIEHGTLPRPADHP